MFKRFRSKSRQRRAERLLRNLQRESTSIEYMSAVRAWGRLNVRDPRAVEPLIQALVHPESSVREWAAEALGKLGEFDLGARQGIVDPSQGLRRLAECRDPRLLKPLLSALRDSSDRGLRSDAAAALGKLGDPRAVQPLIGATMDDDHEVRSHAFQSLGELNTAEGLELLVSEAKGGSRFAVEGLAKFGGDRAADAVIELIDHSQHWRAEAYLLFNALGEIGSEHAIERLVQEVERGEPEAIWPLVRTEHPCAVGVLIRRLNDHAPEEISDQDTAAVQNAAGGLARLGDPRAVEPLIEVLRKNRNPPVDADDFYHADGNRKQILIRVIHALGKLGDSRATERVRELTRHQPDEIQEEALRALGKLDSEEHA